MSKKLITEISNVAETKYLPTDESGSKALNINLVKDENFNKKSKFTLKMAQKENIIKGNVIKGSPIVNAIRKSPIREDAID